MSDLLILFVGFIVVMWAFSPEGHIKERIDLTKSKEDLENDLKESIDRLNFRASSYNELIDKKLAEEKKILNLKSEKESIYSKRNLWESGFFHETKSLLKVVKYLVVSTPILYLLHLTTDPHRETLTDVAFGASALALVMFTLSLIGAYIKERTRLKSSNLEDFIKSECDYHMQTIANIERKIILEDEAHKDTANKVKKIEGELKKRNS